MGLVLQNYQSGKIDRETAAKQLGLTISQFCYRQKKGAIGKKIKRDSPNRIQNRRSRVLQSYKKGAKTPKQIARLLNIPLYIARDDLEWLREEGKITRSKRASKQERQERRDRVVELHSEGLSPTEISQRLKIDSSTVYNDLIWAKKNEKLSRD